MTIPLFDLETLLGPLRDQLLAAAEAVIGSRRFVIGPEVERFETELAAYLGVRHVVGVANGTDALTIALRALGTGAGDEVVVPSFTFYASAEAIPPTGARPVFCDVDPQTMMLTPETVRPCLTPRTKAVIAVHLFGNLAPVAEIEALGVPVLEDAAQALGSRGPAGPAGALGRAATLSFYPTKNLGCLGDGGAVVTSDDGVAELARMLRFHGSRDQRSFELIGVNSRLDELQAAFLRVLLPHLDGWCAARAAAGEHYREAGLGSLVELPLAQPGVRAAWHLYTVRSRHVDAIGAALAQDGIAARVYYRPPLHRQPAMAPFARGARLPVSDELALTHLALPSGPSIGAGETRRVAGVVRGVLEEAGEPSRAGTGSRCG
jgi:dTDP-4-amino-4,6-dideoxygalactose transaminase